MIDTFLLFHYIFKYEKTINIKLLIELNIIFQSRCFYKTEKRKISELTHSS